MRTDKEMEGNRQSRDEKRKNGEREKEREIYNGGKRKLGENSTGKRRCRNRSRSNGEREGKHISRSELVG